MVLRGLFEPVIEAACAVARAEDARLKGGDERCGGEQRFADGGSAIECIFDPPEGCPGLSAAQPGEFFDGLRERRFIITPSRIFPRFWSRPAPKRWVVPSRWMIFGGFN